MTRLTHVDETGKARMVDVSEKDVTLREAVASGVISMKPETFRMVMNAEIAKGDVLGVAKIAGIMAAKKTSELIPLCHLWTSPTLRSASTSRKSRVPLPLKQG